MKKYYYLSVVIAIMLFAVQCFAQSAVKRINAKPIVKRSNKVSTLPQFKPRHNRNKSAVTDSAIFLYYSQDDAYLSFFFPGDPNARYPDQNMQIMNSEYTFADTIGGNENLVKSFEVAFDTLVEFWNDSVRYSYKATDSTEIKVDTLYAFIGQVNFSGAKDTLVFKIDSVDKLGYPTKKVLWADTMVFDTSLSPAASAYQWNNPAELIVPCNYTVHAGKFSFKVEYYGAKIDTLAFMYTFPNYYFNESATCNTGQINQFPDTTKFGGHFGKLTANTFVTGFAGYLDSTVQVPTETADFDGLVYQLDTCITPHINTILPFQDAMLVPTIEIKNAIVATDTIGGTVYIDKNNDSIYDAGDAPVAGISVKLTDIWGKPVATTTTDNNGYYSFSYYPNSMCKIELDSALAPSYKVSVPAMGYVAYQGPSIKNINMAISCMGGFDLSGSLQICIDTPAFGGSSIQACIFNNRCALTKGTLKLIVDTAIHISNIVSDSVAHINGDTLTWNYDSLSDVGKSYCVNLTGTVDSLLATDSVFVTMLITPTIGDSVPSNNSVTYWVKPFPHNCVGIPFDPNEKSVLPEGSIKPSQQLTYTIHFQNTGTAPAKNVVVIDTLSPYVDPTTLKVILSSGELITSIVSGNIVKFTFNNINLVDTATSKTKSIGVVQYTINPLSSAVNGDVIRNTAGIYFDANPVVRTNTTISPITGAPLSVQHITNVLNIAVFPNPFTSTASIVFNTNGKHYLELDDITGRRIESMLCTGRQYELSRNGLAAGIYFIRAFDEGMKHVATAKVVVQ
jgi:hypothetical protein